MFSRIVAANTSKEAWEILRREFHGNPKIMAMKLQTLRQTFECLHIKGNESVQGYISRVNEFVNQMSGLGDTVPDQLDVGKY